MYDQSAALKKLNSNAEIIAAENKKNFESGKDKKLQYGRARCAHYVKLALISGGLSDENSAINSAKDYGPWLIKNGFKVVEGVTTINSGGIYSISGQQAGDVAVIQSVENHPDGHMTMFNGTKWVSDFVQNLGFYPGQTYRNNSVAYKLYRYAGASAKNNDRVPEKGKMNIVWPIPSNNRGSEFKNQDDILAHLAGESTGQYAIGRSGMWHGGIHITEDTTPWCALSGKSPNEAIDFPVPFKGEKAIRCMADGEVVAYRTCKDYQTIDWESGQLSFSGSFVLVKHYIRLGEKESSGLHFYTLYMHLAPYSAYSVNPTERKWTVQDTLTAYDPEWVMSASTKNKAVSDSYSKGTIPKGAIVEWNKSDRSLHTVAFNNREYGLVTFVSLSEEALKKGKKTSFKPGQQYWILVDKNNISPATIGASQPLSLSASQPLSLSASQPLSLSASLVAKTNATSAGDNDVR